MAMLEVNNLSIQFGGLHAVDNFHMKIEKNGGAVRPDQATSRQEKYCPPEYPSFSRI